MERTMLRPTRQLTRREGAVMLARAVDGRLYAGCGADVRAVVVRRCFPWSEPGRYVSLCDDDNHEVALVADPGDLDEVSRLALEEALAEAGFLFEVTGVIEVEEEVEIRHWRVETSQGSRTFQTRLDDWPRALPGGGFLLRDVAGDLYRIPEAETLDRESAKLLWAFVD